jgi:toxin HigB-1
MKKIDISNDQYRLCFRWTNEGPTDVEIVDYH